jgi:hypothetical protein
MHDRLPKLRRDDPSGFVAVALSFVPVLNLIWFFFSFRRLCVRINEQRRFAGLPETAPQTLAVIVATLLLCGAVSTILPLTGWVLLGTTVWVLIPVFIAVLQASVNELVTAGNRSTAQQGHDQQDAEPDLRDSDRDLRPAGERRSLAGSSAPGSSSP